MVNSINAGEDMNILFSGKNSVFNKSIMKGEAAEDQAVATEKNNAAAVSADGDELELSNASTGVKLSMKEYTGKSAKSATEVASTNIGKNASIMASAAKSMGVDETTELKSEMSTTGSVVASGSSTSSSSSSSSSSLDQYTEAELKQMLNNGEITQQEYNAEISSRKEDSSSSEDEESSSIAGATMVSASNDEDE